MKRGVKTLILSGVSLCLAVVTMFVVSSPSRKISNDGFGENIATVYYNQSVNDLLYSVTGTRSKYSLPYDISAAPKAPDGNYSTAEEDGIEKQVYKDETLEAVCWKETLTTKVGGTNCKAEFTFADVKISDPSQFRCGWAGSNPNNPKRMPPTTIFNNCNGVVGMSADFFSYRRYGIIYQYGEEILNRKSYKDKSNDVLVVDYNGDFSIYDSVDLSKKIKNEGKSFTDTMMFSFTFGPGLVVNGENTHSEKFSTQVLGELTNVRTGKPHYQARACIGQIGTLHYLLCTVGEVGTDMSSLADIMVEKGCVTAYNLDGGQSGTLLFKDNHYNTVAYNSESTEKYGERAQDRIIYFGTAKQ